MIPVILKVEAYFGYGSNPGDSGVMKARLAAVSRGLQRHGSDRGAPRPYD